MRAALKLGFCMHRGFPGSLFPGALLLDFSLEQKVFIQYRKQKVLEVKQKRNGTEADVSASSVFLMILGEV